MSARDNILAGIRARRVKGGVDEDASREAVRAHIAAHAQNPRPGVNWDAAARFRTEALKLSSTIDEVASMTAVPGAVAAYLEAQRLPREAVCWTELAPLDWRSAGIEVLARPALPADLVGITGAFCAIAETGTLVLLSGPATPSAASLLPETHVAVIEKSRIVSGMEETWQLIRSELGQLPRAVNFVSGPSRTADIEQTVTLGAHGPYRVHVVLVGTSG